MTVVDVLVAYGLIAVGATFIGWLLFDGFRHWAAQPLDVVFEDGVNDDLEAGSRFIDVVQHAEHELIVHDDGNDMPGTIYNDEEVIRAVDQQMAKHEKLVVKCLFNARAKLALVEQLSERYSERFHVRYRRWRWPRPAFDVHYKIADRGAIGHLSHHDYGAEDRYFEVRNCLGVNQRERNIEFGKYMRRFKRQFRLAAWQRPKPERQRQEATQGRSEAA